MAEPPKLPEARDSGAASPAQRRAVAACRTASSFGREPGWAVATKSSRFAMVELFPGPVPFADATVDRVSTGSVTDGAGSWTAAAEPVGGFAPAPTCR
jgi:hypothetical protein